MIANDKKSTSDRQTLFLIHGPVGTGKSTTARLLITDKDSQYVNRIWIKAETTQTLEQDFRQLYKRMKALQYPLPNEQQDFNELLICLYRNLMTKSTLIVFDNAAVVDIDPTSVFKQSYNLLMCLNALRSTSLTPGQMVAPAVVITTRAVFGHQETPSFSLLGLTPFNSAVSVPEDAVWKQLEVDLQLIFSHSHGKLGSFLFLLILLSNDKGMPVWMLNRLCRRCPAVDALLNHPDPVSENDVEIALKLLESFSMIESTSTAVRLPDAIKVTAGKVLETPAFSEIICQVPAAIINICASKEFFDMELDDIDIWAVNLNMIIQNIYPYLLEKETRPTSILMFDIPGNSLERRHDLVMSNVPVVSGSIKKSYTSDLQSNTQSCMEWMRFALGGSTPANLVFQKQNPYVIAKSLLLQGNVKNAAEDYFGRDTDCEPSYTFKMHQTEYYLKLGKLAEAGQLSARGSHTVHNGTLLHELPEVMQARILTSQGKHLKARDLLQTSLERIKTTHGRNAGATASIKHVLARSEALVGEFGSALQLIEHVIGVRRQLLGVTTVRYIEAVSTKVKILTLQGDYQKAEECMTAAQTDFSNKTHYYVYADGDVQNHPHFLILRYYQAKIWYHQERFPEASKELAVIQPLFGETNVYWFKCQLLHSRILRDTGKLKLSKACLKVLVNQAEGVYQGADNHQALKFKLAYAENLVLQRNFKAEQLAETVLQNASPNSISLHLRAKCILAQIRKRQNIDDIAPALKDLSEDSSKWCGPFHVQTLKFKLQLVEELLRNPKKDVTEVEQLMHPVLDFLESRKYKQESGMLLSWYCLHALKLVQYKIGTSLRLALIKSKIYSRHTLSATKCSAMIKYFEAIRLSQQCHYAEAYTAASELMHFVATSPVVLEEPDTGEISTFLAFLLLKTKGFDALPEAVNWCLSSLRSTVRAYGSEHWRTTQAKFNLAVFYGISVDLPKARKLIEEVTSAAQNDPKAKELNLDDLRFALSTNISGLEFRIGGRIVLIHKGAYSGLA